MTLIVDSSFLVALYNVEDAFHRQALRFGDQNTELWVVPDVVLPETCYLSGATSATLECKDFSSISRV